MTDIMEVTENVVNQEILNVNVETATASLNSGKKTPFENATVREETRCRTIGKEVKAVDDFECSVIPRKRARTEYSSIEEVNIPEETFELKSMSSDETVLRPVFHEALASSINTKEIPTEERIGIDTPIINKVEIPIVNSPTEATTGKKENFSVEETSSTLEGIRDVQDFKKFEKNIPMMEELFEETNHSL
ncbi:uncharacterized protein [Leptinotarsa decemlineata]|uniref:uncharacterized protein n=1 Tax=Leptinotarsa decemlineata TaxID=7539 RepID=UPI003D308CF2